MYDTEGMLLLTFFLVTVIGVIILFSLITYFVFAYGLYKMAQKQGFEKPWYAFIPIAQMYLFSQVVQDESSIKDLPKITLISQILIILFSITVGLYDSMDGLGMFVSLVYSAYVFYLFHLLFRKYNRDNAVILTVLNVILNNILGIIYVFIKRNELPVNMTKKHQNGEIEEVVQTEQNDIKKED